jgi:Kdo2-lipid IVA lauroyltransferase/acyltransferase
MDATRAPLVAEPRSAVPWAYRFEAWGAALSTAILRSLPLDLASALGGWLGRRIGPRLRVSRLAHRNLRAAVPDLSEQQIDRIVRGMWDNLGRVAAEYPHLRDIRVFGSGSRVETRGLEHLDDARAAGRRVILFGGHLANWEIGGLAAAQYGLDIAQIYRAPNNPLIDRMLTRLRGEGSELIPKCAVASRRAVAALRRGGHVSLLADQKLNEGIAVPFFDRPAMTAPALALLALHFDCVVLPVRVERLQGARFRLTVYPPLDAARTGNRDADTLALMTAVNATLEAWIRERPEQWFWVHHRWPD